MINIDECDIVYPGRIVDFDASNQTATVRVAIEHLTSGFDYSYRATPRALLLDVPIQFPQGGGWDITFPVKADDHCLIFFSQRGYDHWLYSNSLEAGVINDTPAPDHNRAFDARDALAIVGFRPIPAAIPNFYEDGMELRNEARTQRITLRDNLDVEIETTGTVSVTAPTVNITGDVNISGTLTVDGLNMNTHIHRIGSSETTEPMEG